jgi:hypothetical protein
MTPSQAFKIVERLGRAYVNGAPLVAHSQLAEALRILRATIDDRRCAGSRRRSVPTAAASVSTAAPDESTTDLLLPLYCVAPTPTDESS